MNNLSSEVFCYENLTTIGFIRLGVDDPERRVINNTWLIVDTLYPFLMTMWLCHLRPSFSEEILSDMEKKS